MTRRTLFIYMFLLSIAILQVGAAKARSEGKPQERRQWESTGIVNCTGPVFTCSNDHARMVKLSFRCDGKKDCTDGSDEEKCTECSTPFSAAGKNGFLECIRSDEMHRKMQRAQKYQRAKPADWNSKDDCADHELRCPESGVCLPFARVCDGITDCLEDPVDERSCTECNGGAKFCKPRGTCIPTESLCDGVKDCSDGSDEHDCICSSCNGPDRALCGNGRCIDSKFVCDGVMDCEDASDEQGCPTSCGDAVNASTTLPTIVECGSSYSKKRYLLSDVCSGIAPECDMDELCPSGCDSRISFECSTFNYIPWRQYYTWRRNVPYHEAKCIPKAQVCDGKHDCGNGEDEENCLKACRKYPHFTRLNKLRNKCISMDNRCDGVFDFADGSDEKNCDKCPSTAFRCDGGCIPSTSRCDGVKDCKDGADEKNCSCEECTSGRMDTYSCEATQTCLKRSNACGNGNRSLCPKPTARDEVFCIGQARRR